MFYILLHLMLNWRVPDLEKSKSVSFLRPSPLVCRVLVIGWWMITLLCTSLF